MAKHGRTVRLGAVKVCCKVGLLLRSNVRELKIPVERPRIHELVGKVNHFIVVNCKICYNSGS